MKSLFGVLLQALLWMLLAGLALQIFFVARIALLAVFNPASTSFMRSEAVRLATARGPTAMADAWRHTWVDAKRLSPHLLRAVIASEDAGFFQHGGVEWEAIESAWQRNQKRQAQAERAAQAGKTPRPPRLQGGSTLTQQLAKNLLLSGERTLLRKGQELMLTLALETLLDKPRILEIYLNSVEWGEGLFGAEAAAQHHFRKSAAQLTPAEAARLAVMLPSPKRHQKRPQSAYLNQRTQTILARMGAVELP